MDKLVLKSHQNIGHFNLIKKLFDLGYKKVNKIDGFGEFCKIGGVIQITPVNDIKKYLIDFFGDNIDTIKEYDTGNKILNLVIKSNKLMIDNKIIYPDDFIVHIDHGVGIFRGLGQKKVAGKYQKYIFIEYLNNDYLYVPHKTKDRIFSYIGVGKRAPRLNKLGTDTWRKTKKRTYQSILVLAKELLEVYASREIVIREPYKFDKTWNEIIQKSFGFKETPDQTKTLNTLWKDLKNNRPMDRLICGDVGFGKTEVAIRVITQVLANNFQVALLCPTTILSEQHLALLKRRFKKLPVRIESLSRFGSKTYQKEVVKGLSSGQVDLVVGTHRLLSDDLRFKNLGMVVVDEEQKFGVKQKEKLKRMRNNLDILSLSATPIPRTLFMSLSGIRDISQINTAPYGRREIKSQVQKYDFDLVIKYIKREMKRKGQLYYLHNNLQTIKVVKEKLQKNFPEIKISIAHGQMPESNLARVMGDFVGGKIDILVCSTIIGNGLDIANANTLIVDEADKFGLAQLYQIRGRIGRGKKQAYCLFTHRNKTITPGAFERLKSLVDNSKLGSGLKIAISDLEIRGGGNILGREQHGNMELVGLALYTKLLKKAVDRLRE